MKILEVLSKSLGVCTHSILTLAQLMAVFSHNTKIFALLFILQAVVLYKLVTDK